MASCEHIEATDQRLAELLVRFIARKKTDSAPSDPSLEPMICLTCGEQINDDQLRSMCHQHHDMKQHPIFIDTAARQFYCTVCKTSTEPGPTFQSMQLLSGGTPLAPTPVFAAPGQSRSALPSLGLVNVANTCYLNSTLQALSHTVPFSSFFLGFALQILTAPAPPLLGPPSARDTGLQAHLLRALTKLMVAMKHPPAADLGVVKPTEFTHLVQTVVPMFAGTQQHDAQEAFLLLMDNLRKAVVSVLGVDGLVAPVFEGTMATAKTCRQCGLRTSTDDPFLDLSLPFVQDQASLAAMLRAFSQGGVITATCEKCGVATKHALTVKLARAPPVLVFHLKRFKQTGAAVEKIADHVEFPLAGLDLSRLTARRPEPSPSGIKAMGLPIADSDVSDAELVPQPLESDHGEGDDRRVGAILGLDGRTLPVTPETVAHDATVYDCVGVVTHSGKIGYGHYIAYGRCGSEWHEYNDHETKLVAPSTVAGAEAYLLVYSARQTRRQQTARTAVAELLTQPADPKQGMAALPSEWLFRLTALPFAGPLAAASLHCPFHPSHVGRPEWWRHPPATRRTSGQYPPFTVISRSAADRLHALYGGERLPDFDGVMRCPECELARVRERERTTLCRYDQGQPECAAYAVPSTWLAGWVDFACKNGPRPSVIDMMPLVKRVRKGVEVEPGTDYRLLSAGAMRCLADWYGFKGKHVRIKDGETEVIDLGDIPAG
ncbi:Ubiquitin carboxyl-terminal hydrolase [Carpediemonas membranifera]|uniref:Ubiquitin carboxyl-terminal hydrolase n=1 Tax=Carpediemonas membranifera TaxID=201153 RepID=A0A8J6B093_9EUKA|nr:Ubiquitin carboxyl-terminal hydrolase [Carpediemonas membranifera]|eukprot:KAG9392733.1 Ubiquitin carboxyl-terminal hydrolase [Carpediemonas membranifera]